MVKYVHAWVHVAGLGGYGIAAWYGIWVWVKVVLNSCIYVQCDPTAKLNPQQPAAWLTAQYVLITPENPSV